MSRPEVAPTAIRCAGVDVRYTVRSHRPLLRDLLRGNAPEATTVHAVRGVDLEVRVGESVGRGVSVDVGTVTGA